MRLIDDHGITTRDLRRLSFPRAYSTSQGMEKKLLLLLCIRFFA